MKKLLMFLATISFGQIQSQDLIGANLRTKWVSGYTYSYTLTLFADPSFSVSRPTVTVNFGDATSASFPLSFGPGMVKTYSGTHTYSSAGNYQAYFLDSYRISNIKNMSNSQTQQISASALIVTNNFSFANTSPDLTVLPMGFGTGGGPLLYNGGWYDNDGDSISYSLSNCTGSNYYIPSNATIDDVTGTFTFTKDSVGLYAFNFKVTEWRKNLSNVCVVIGYTEMDFTIDVVNNTIGMNELKKTQVKLNAYPNPATNDLYVSCDKTLSGNSSIEVINSLGQVVLKTNYAGKINISELPRGLYFVRLSDKNNSSDFIKFIKN
jgi:hypothetical protein